MIPSIEIIAILPRHVRQGEIVGLTIRLRNTGVESFRHLELRTAEASVYGEREAILTDLEPGGTADTSFNLHFQNPGKPALKFRFRLETANGVIFWGEAVEKVAVQPQEGQPSNFTIDFGQRNEFDGERAGFWRDDHRRTETGGQCPSVTGGGRERHPSWRRRGRGAPSSADWIDPAGSI